MDSAFVNDIWRCHDIANDMGDSSAFVGHIYTYVVHYYQRNEHIYIVAERFGASTPLGVRILVFTQCNQQKRHQKLCSCIELQLQSY